MHIAGFGLPRGATHAASQFDALGSGQQSTMAGMGAGVTGVIGTTGISMTGAGVGIMLGLVGVTGEGTTGTTGITGVGLVGVATDAPATFLKAFIAFM